MIARIRVSVPNRPGTLGAVASALGNAGADILKLDVLATESGRAVDDLFLTVRDAAHLSAVVSALSALAGCSVLGQQGGVATVTDHADLELVARVLAQPARATETLVDGAPVALGASWAAVLEYGPGGAVATLASVAAPPVDQIAVSSPCRLTAIRLSIGDEELPMGSGALVPLTPASALLLVREHGLTFHPSELWRFGQVGEIAGTLLSPPQRSGAYAAS